MTSENPAIAIEAFNPADLPAALRIQSQTYPAFLIEDEAAFRSRLDLATSYCLTAKRGDALLGYCLAHGWRGQSPPPVGTVLENGGPSEVVFIHDLAVASSARGLKIGERLVAHALALAANDGLRTAELIAVEGASDYWRRLGFIAGDVAGELKAKVASYGAAARWMTREISPKC